LHSYIEFYQVAQSGLKEENIVADKSTKLNANRRGPPTPPKMNKAEWLRRDRTSVTLTRGELEQLARLISAGHVMLHNEPSVSPRLRNVMSRLGISTKGYNWRRQFVCAIRYSGLWP
jgi:hypothetical protein